MNPYGSDKVVDLVLGSAYQVTKYVSDNMETLIGLTETTDTLCKIHRLITTASQKVWSELYLSSRIGVDQGNGIESAVVAQLGSFYQNFTSTGFLILRLFEPTK